MKSRMMALILAACLALAVCGAACEAAPERTEQDYAGNWMISSVYVDGIGVGFGTLEWIAGLVYEGGAGYRVEDAVLTLEPGMATLTAKKGDELKTKQSAAIFENGELKLTDPLGILGKDVVLTLRDDGQLVSRAGVSYGILGFSIEVFLVRQTAEAAGDSRE